MNTILIWGFTLHLTTFEMVVYAVLLSFGIPFLLTWIASFGLSDNDREQFGLKPRKKSKHRKPTRLF